MYIQKEKCSNQSSESPPRENQKRKIKIKGSRRNNSIKAGINEREKKEKSKCWCFKSNKTECSTMDNQGMGKMENRKIGRSPPLKGTPNLQLFTEQHSKRMTTRLAENLFKTKYIKRIKTSRRKVDTVQ